jgi:uncharacterized protein
MSDNADLQSRLIESLKESTDFPGTDEKPVVIETHISTVFLAGDYAWKLKKPVNFGFLDFSSLDQRRHFCEEELRLNRRLAPELYLDVVSITGSPEHPVIGGAGEALEYAVKMRRFKQDDLFNNLLAAGKLDDALIRQVGRIAADFHAHAARASMDMPYGSAEAAFSPMQQNFDQLRDLITDQSQLEQLDELERWTRQRYEALRETLDQRKKDGFIRECHGDMHLGNIALIDGEVAVFDGIEFNDFFRWGDVMSEIAFLTMDLDHRGDTWHSNIVLNEYLEKSGDYAGLELLRFYQVYRAMVRAKVSSFRLAQELSDAERTEVLEQYQGFVSLAEHYTRLDQPALILMHGFSGSGKTVVSGKLCPALGAIRLRSDVERKRLNALTADEDASAAITAGIYSQEMTELTYGHLAETSKRLLKSGFAVIVDATFLKKVQRDLFSGLTRHWYILDITADTEVLRSNIRKRQSQGDASDASLEVLEHQLQSHDPLTDDEPVLSMLWDAELPVDEIRTRLNL